MNLMDQSVLDIQIKRIKENRRVDRIMENYRLAVFPAWATHALSKGIEGKKSKSRILKWLGL